MDNEIQHKRYKRGMTLIELMIVVGLIAFLAILITSYLRSQVFKGNDAKKKTDINRIGIAVEEYEKDKNCYPLTSQVICNPGTGLLPYLDKIPCDPSSKASYFYEHEDSVCPRWYRIYASLENESDTSYEAYIGPNGAYSYFYGSPNAPEVASSPPQGGGDGGGGQPDTNFYGCFSGICTLIIWDTNRPGPSCDPNYQNPTCYGQCAGQANECQSWD